MMHRNSNRTVGPLASALRPLAWVGCLLLAGCASTTTRPAQPLTAVDAAEVASVDAWTGELASTELEGRAPGTAGLDRARDIIADAFAAAGLAPAFGDGYLQPLSVALGAELTDKQLRFGERRVDDGDYTVLGLGASGGFAGEAVFVGYAISDTQRGYDSMAGAADDVLTGKVAVVLRYEPLDDQRRSRWTSGAGWTQHAHLAAKVRWAQERGAVGVVIVNPPARERAQLPSLAMTAFGRRAEVPVVMGKTGLLERLLEAAGRDRPERVAEQWQRRADAGQPHVVPLDVNVRGRVEVASRRGRAHNVAAIAPGRGDLADEVIVVGAHYDHVGTGEWGGRDADAVGRIHPGADDNASGTAAVLLLARRYGERLADGVAPAGRRTVLFVGFTAEERGLVGSDHFVRHLDQVRVDGRPLGSDQIIAMLNLDMVGRLREAELTVFGTATADRWLELLEAAAEEAGLSLNPRPHGSGPSDQRNFYRLRIPVLHFFTGLHDDYHTPADTADRLNLAGIVRVANVVDAMVRQLWAGPATVAFVPPPEGGRRGEGAAGAGNGAVLGIVPARESIGGSRIASVTPDSAADDAGLQAEDVIVAWDGEPIANTIDLARRVRDADPGDAVTLTVMRDHDQMQISVRLGGR